MRFLVAVGATLVVAFAACGSSAAQAGPPARDSVWVTEDSHCKEPEHDFCTVVRRRGDTTQLDLANIGHSLPYRLCVVPVGSPSARQCRSFKTRQRHPAYVFASKVVFQKAFTSRHHTRYRATWTMVGGRPLGRPLLFTAP